VGFSRRSGGGGTPEYVRGVWGAPAPQEEGKNIFIVRSVTQAFCQLSSFLHVSSWLDQELATK
jgi:hypothetical protein